MNEQPNTLTREEVVAYVDAISDEAEQLLFTMCLTARTYPEMVEAVQKEVRSFERAATKLTRAFDVQIAAGIEWENFVFGHPELAA